MTSGSSPFDIVAYYWRAYKQLWRTSNMRDVPDQDLPREYRNRIQCLMAQEDAEAALKAQEAALKAAITPLDSFVGHIHACDGLLDGLRELVRDHLGVHPDACTWSDVADVNRLRERLQDTLDMLTRSGEYTP